MWVEALPLVGSCLLGSLLTFTQSGCALLSQPTSPLSLLLLASHQKLGSEFLSKSFPSCLMKNAARNSCCLLFISFSCYRLSWGCKQPKNMGCWVSPILGARF